LNIKNKNTNARTVKKTNIQTKLLNLPRLIKYRLIKVN
jgi:hypothetical protein